MVSFKILLLALLVVAASTTPASERRSAEEDSGEDEQFKISRSFTSGGSQSGSKGYGSGYGSASGSSSQNRGSKGLSIGGSYSSKSQSSGGGYSSDGNNAVQGRSSKGGTSTRRFYERSYGKSGQNSGGRYSSDDESYGVDGQNGRSGKSEGRFSIKGGKRSGGAAHYHGRSYKRSYGGKTRSSGKRSSGSRGSRSSIRGGRASGSYEADQDSRSRSNYINRRSGTGIRISHGKSFGRGQKYSNGGYKTRSSRKSGKSSQAFFEGSDESDESDEREFSLGRSRKTGKAYRIKGGISTSRTSKSRSGSKSGRISENDEGGYKINRRRSGSKIKSDLRNTIGRRGASFGGSKRFDLSSGVSSGRSGRRKQSGVAEEWLARGSRQLTQGGKRSKSTQGNMGIIGITKSGKSGIFSSSEGRSGQGNIMNALDKLGGVINKGKSGDAGELFKQMLKMKKGETDFNGSLEPWLLVIRGLSKINNAWMEGLGTDYENIMMAFLRIVNCVDSVRSTFNIQTDGTPDICKPNFGAKLGWEKYTKQNTVADILEFHGISKIAAHLDELLEKATQGQGFEKGPQQLLLKSVRSILDILQKDVSEWTTEDIAAFFTNTAGMLGGIAKTYNENLGSMVIKSIIQNFGEFAKHLGVDLGTAIKNHIGDDIRIIKSVGGALFGSNDDDVDDSAKEDVGDDDDDDNDEDIDKKRDGEDIADNVEEETDRAGDVDKKRGSDDVGDNIDKRRDNDEHDDITEASDDDDDKKTIKENKRRTASSRASGGYEADQDSKTRSSQKSDKIFQDDFEGSDESDETEFSLGRSRKTGKAYGIKGGISTSRTSRTRSGRKSGRNSGNDEGGYKINRRRSGSKIKSDLRNTIGRRGANFGGSKRFDLSSGGRSGRSGHKKQSGVAEEWLARGSRQLTQDGRGSKSTQENMGIIGIAKSGKSGIFSNIRGRSNGRRSGQGNIIHSLDKLGGAINKGKSGGAGELFKQMLKMKKGETDFNGSLEPWLLAIQGLSKINNAWMEGLGTDYENIMMAFLRIVNCVDSVRSTFNIQTDEKPDICKPDFGAKWGWKKYTKQNTVADILEFHGISKIAAHLDELLEKATQDQGFEKGPQQLLLKSVRSILDILQKDVSEWTTEDIAAFFTNTAGMLGGVAKTYNENLGSMILKSIIQNFGEFAKHLGVDLATAIKNHIGDDIRIIKSLGGALFGSNDDDVDDSVKDNVGDDDDDDNDEDVDKKRDGEDIVDNVEEETDRAGDVDKKRGNDNDLSDSDFGANADKKRDRDGNVEGSVDKKIDSDNDWSDSDFGGNIDKKRDRDGNVQGKADTKGSEIDFDGSDFGANADKKRDSDGNVQGNVDTRGSEKHFGDSDFGANADKKRDHDVNVEETVDKKRGSNNDLSDSDFDGNVDKKRDHDVNVEGTVDKKRSSDNDFGNSDFGGNVDKKRDLGDNVNKKRGTDDDIVDNKKRGSDDVSNNIDKRRDNDEHDDVTVASDDDDDKKIKKENKRRTGFRYCQASRRKAQKSASTKTSKTTLKKDILLKSLEHLGKVLDNEKCDNAGQELILISKNMRETTIDGAVKSLLTVVRAIAKVLNGWIDGLGDNLKNMVHAVLRSVLCVESLTQRIAPELLKAGLPKLELCSKNYGSEWGWKAYTGSYESADEVIEIYDLKNVLGNLEDLVQSRQLGATGQVIVDNIKGIANIIEKDVNNWTKNDLVQVFVKLSTILGGTGSAINEKLGPQIVIEFLDFFSEFAGTGGEKLSKYKDTILQEVSKCGRSTLGGVIKDVKDLIIDDNESKRADNNDNNKVVNKIKDKAQIENGEIVENKQHDDGYETINEKLTTSTNNGKFNEDSDDDDSRIEKSKNISIADDNDDNDDSEDDSNDDGIYLNNHKYYKSGKRTFTNDDDDDDDDDDRDDDSDNNRLKYKGTDNNDYKVTNTKKTSSNSFVQNNQYGEFYGEDDDDNDDDDNDNDDDSDDGYGSDEIVEESGQYEDSHEDDDIANNLDEENNNDFSYKKFHSKKWRNNNSKKVYDKYGKKDDDNISRDKLIKTRTHSYDENEIDQDKKSKNIAKQIINYDTNEDNSDSDESGSSESYEDVDSYVPKEIYNGRRKTNDASIRQRVTKGGTSTSRYQPGYKYGMYDSKDNDKKVNKKRGGKTTETKSAGKPRKTQDSETHLSSEFKSQNADSGLIIKSKGKDYGRSGRRSTRRRQNKRHQNLYYQKSGATDIETTQDDEEGSKATNSAVVAKGSISASSIAGSTTSGSTNQRYESDSKSTASSSQRSNSQHRHSRSGHKRSSKSRPSISGNKLELEHQSGSDKNTASWTKYGKRSGSEGGVRSGDKKSSATKHVEISGSKSISKGAFNKDASNTGRSESEGGLDIEFDESTKSGKRSKTSEGRAGKSSGALNTSVIKGSSRQSQQLGGNKQMQSSFTTKGDEYNKQEHAEENQSSSGTRDMAAHLEESKQNSDGSYLNIETKNAAADKYDASITSKLQNSEIKDGNKLNKKQAAAVELSSSQQSNRKSATDIQNISSGGEVTKTDNYESYNAGSQSQNGWITSNTESESSSSYSK